MGPPPGDGCPGDMADKGGGGVPIADTVVIGTGLALTTDTVSGEDGSELGLADPI